MIADHGWQCPLCRVWVSRSDTHGHTIHGVEVQTLEDVYAAGYARARAEDVAALRARAEEHAVFRVDPKRKFETNWARLVLEATTCAGVIEALKPAAAPGDETEAR